jgi:hypothetical protein
MLINNAHIWIGLFDSKKRLEKYMDETYGEDDDETPISEFARDQKQWFYDHDLVYAEYIRKATMQSLIEIWRFPEQSVVEVLAAIEKLGPIKANASFIADKDEFKTPGSATGNGYELWYLGQFDGCNI